jgi:hypothetical protein
VLPWISALTWLLHCELLLLQAQEHVEANVPLAAAPRLAEKMWQLVEKEMAATLQQQQQKAVAV